jgi:hypothetical protein
MSFLSDTIKSVNHAYNDNDYRDLFNKDAEAIIDYATKDTLTNGSEIIKGTMFKKTVAPVFHKSDLQTNVNVIQAIAKDKSKPEQQRFTECLAKQADSDNILSSVATQVIDAAKKRASEHDNALGVKMAKVTTKTIVNAGLAIGATIAAPFTGGASAVAAPAVAIVANSKIDELFKVSSDLTDPLKRQLAKITPYYWEAQNVIATIKANPYTPPAPAASNGLAPSGTKKIVAATTTHTHTLLYCSIAAILFIVIILILVLK